MDKTVIITVEKTDIYKVRVSGETRIEQIQAAEEEVQAGGGEFFDTKSVNATDIEPAEREE